MSPSVSSRLPAAIFNIHQPFISHLLPSNHQLPINSHTIGHQSNIHQPRISQSPLLSLLSLLAIHHWLVIGELPAICQRFTIHGMSTNSSHPYNDQPIVVGCSSQPNMRNHDNQNYVNVWGQHQGHKAWATRRLSMAILSPGKPREAQATLWARPPHH